MPYTPTPAQIKIMDDIDARRREDDPGRMEFQFYSTYCRAMDNGNQWVEREMNTPGFQRFSNKVQQAAQDSSQPMLTTLNRITRNIRRNAAASRPQKLDVTKAQPIGTPTTQGQADSGIMKVAASIGIDLAHLLSNAQRASFERSITGLHGYGFRYVKYGTDGQTVDVGVEGYDFEGHRLTLDPMNTSTNLLDHNFVIYSEVVTFDHAKRLYGEKAFADAGIKEEELSTIATLSPVECGMNRVSGGKMYQNYAQQANTKGLVLTWAYFKESPTRFNKLHVMADTGGGSGYGHKRGRVLLSNEAAVNPYAGNGMPMGTLAGWDRSGSRYPISDVGLMVDDQIKTNICASLWIQGLWDRVNSTLVVDKNMLAGNNTDPDSIWDSLADGVLLLQRTGDRGAMPPQYLTAPPPDPTAAEGFRYFENATRDSSFQTATNEGQTKSHVPASTTQLAVELSALPLDDRQNRDIESYEAVIETLAMSIIGLGAGGSKTIVKMLKNAGITDSQLQRLVTMDLTLSPCKLRIAREHIIRRSRSRRIAELQFAVSIGALSPQEYRDAMSDMDMPLSDQDKAASQYVDEAVLRVVLGEEIEPIALEEHFPSFKRAIKSAMMEHNADPEIVARLRDALDDQLETEQLMAEHMGLITGEGGGQQQQPQQAGPQLPPELELSQVVGNQGV